MNGTKHHPLFINTILTLRPLLREHKPLKSMPFEELCDWMSFYWNRGTITWSIDGSGQPHAVCLIKLFRHLNQFIEPAVHEPCGEFVMIELLVADEPNAMAEVCEALCERWGVQKVVMWDRGERTENGAPRMMTWAQFRKLAHRITYGLVKGE